MQAFDDGKKIEQMVWHGLPSWMPKENPQWDWAYFDYRVAAEPKLRPWRMEEVPVGALIRDKSKTYKSVIVECNEYYIFTGNDRSWEFGKPVSDADLMQQECSRDGGATWQPCGVLE